MRLHEIVPGKGSNKPRRRVGRGEGGGRGKTSGRGHKGQTSHSGDGVRVGFEGGQMPLYRRLPIRGFSNFRFRTSYQVVNVGALDKVVGTTVNGVTLAEVGLVRDASELVKLLATGEVTRALQVTVDHVSAAAKAKIEAAGGTVTLTGRVPAKASADEGAA